ncbi:MAG: hypothetical protein ACI9D0_000200 [Bacteroidia bacterium]|jgi:hypothetical protein
MKVTLPKVALSLGLVAMLATACNKDEPAPTVAPDQTGATEFIPSNPNPPTAVHVTHGQLIEDMATPRHISDGQGTVRILDGPQYITASEVGSWTFEFEVSEHGIAAGGSLFFMVSPYWYWTNPQTQSPEGPGYVSASLPSREEGDELVLQAISFGNQLCQIEVTGRALRPGELVEVAYGQGAGARADRYAEKESRFWFSVDGDGDGVRGILPDSPTIEVLPGRPATLQLILPSTVRVGETATITVALVDRFGNGNVGFDGELLLKSDRRWPGLPERIYLSRLDKGRTQIELSIAPDAPIGEMRFAGAAVGSHLKPTPGSPPEHGLELGGAAVELSAISNPMRILAADSDAPRILWADLHGHSNLSDGTGTPEDFYDYARYVAGLDIAALTDHDHWGVEFLDKTPAMWERIGEVAKNNNEPGVFTSLLAYEWTSWIHGHRHVVYFEDKGEVYSSVDEDFDDPAELWAALRGQEALTFAHHSAGGPVATNWSFVPDPILEPVTEVASVHGSSEAWDSPGLIYRPLKGNFVRDVLDRGIRFGFVGSGDSHDGHPGLAHIASPSGGLAAILAKDNTRESVLEALRARRVYATTGQRIVLDVRLGGNVMGAAIPAESLENGSALLEMTVLGTAPLTRLEVIRSGEVVQRFDAAALGQTTGGQPHWTGELRLDNLKAGEYVYLRVTQQGDGAPGIAWSSPWFLDSPEATEIGD